MKKLLLALSSIAAIAEAPLIAQSFLVNNIQSITNLKLNEISQNNYATIENTLRTKYIAMEYCNTKSKDGVDQQLTFGLTSDQKSIDIIKTDSLTGKSESESIYKYTGNTEIRTIIGRGSYLYIFLDDANSKIQILDFSKAINYLNYSNAEYWFQDYYENDSGKEVTKVEETVKDFLGLDGEPDEFFIFPRTNNFVSFDSFSHTLTVSFMEDDGTINNASNPNISVKNTSLKSVSDVEDWKNATSFVCKVSKSDSKTATNMYAFGRHGNDNQNFWIQDMANSSSIPTKVIIKDKSGNALETHREPLMVDDGHWMYMAIGKRLYYFNGDSISTDLSEGTLTLKYDPSFIADSDITFMQLTKFGNYVYLYYGTSTGIYISIITLGDFSDDKKNRDNDIFSDGVKISDHVINYIDDMNTNTVGISNNKFYINNGTSVDLLAKKINIDFNSGETLDVTDDWSSGNNTPKYSEISDKVDYLYNKLISKSSLNDSVNDISYNDFFVALKSSGLEDFSNPNNQKAVYPQTFTLDGSKTSFYNGSFTLKYGVKAEDDLTKNVDIVLKSLSHIDLGNQFDVLTDKDKLFTNIKTTITNQMDNNDYIKWCIDSGSLTKDFFNIESISLTNSKLKTTSDRNSTDNSIKIVYSYKNLNDEKISGSNNSIYLYDIGSGIMNLPVSDITITKNIGKVKISNYDALKNYYGSEKELNNNISVTLNKGTHSWDDSTDNNNNDNGNKNLTSDHSEKDVDLKNYFKTYIKDGYVYIEYTSTESWGDFTGSITLKSSDNNIKINDNNASSVDINFSGTFTKATKPAKKSIPWKLILIIIGSILLLLLLALFIFALIRWIIPAIASKTSTRSRKSKGVKKIKKSNMESRIPQKTSDANAVRHTKKMSLKTAKENSDGGIIRSGIFKREIDVNETKFKNPTRREDTIGYELEDGTVTDHWSHLKDSDDKNKKPYISKVSRKKLEEKEQEVLERLKEIKKEKLNNSSKKSENK